MKINKEISLLHDLRNKLIILEHNLMKISEKNNPAESINEFESSRLSLDRSFELIKNYMDEKSDHNQFHTVDVQTILIEESEPHYDDLARLYGIKIELFYNLDGSNQKILVNPFTFKKVRENIVENAVKAGATKLDILFDGTDKDFFEVSYKDNGSGIQSELLNEINNYGISKNIISTKHIGTKLIKEICEEHGFAIDYDSIEQGTFIKLLCPYVI